MGNTLICKPEDCDNCPYPDCIGRVRQKPGRKKLPPEVLHKNRIQQNRRYQQEHRDEINRKNLERYYRKKHEKQKTT